MIKEGLRYQPNELDRTSHALRASIPLRATKRNENRTNEFEGRLETLAEGEAQICLDRPLAEGTKLELLVGFTDR
jgi:hypothetical protein